MNNFWITLRNIVHGKDYLRKLILVNSAVFILLGLFNLVGQMTATPTIRWVYAQVIQQLTIPSDINAFIYRPWTLFTYMFVHTGIFQILFAMLWLYWMGGILQEFLGTRKLLSTYIWGGLLSGAALLLSANLIPGLQVPVEMMGSTTGVMAVIVASATLVPHYEVQLFLFGRIQLRWVAVAYVLLDLLFFIPPYSISLYAAHITAAIFGYTYIYNLKHHTFVGDGIHSMITFFRSVKLFAPKPVSKTKHAKPNVYTTAGYDWEEEEPSQEIVDAILDKISQSGYGSLSEKEKQILFKASKQN